MVLEDGGSAPTTVGSECWVFSATNMQVLAACEMLDVQKRWQDRACRKVLLPHAVACQTGQTCEQGPTVLLAYGKTQACLRFN